MRTPTLDDRVIELHDIARQVEREIGNGQLAKDIRSTADQLNELIKKLVVKPKGE